VQDKLIYAALPSFPSYLMSHRSTGLHWSSCWSGSTSGGWAVASQLAKLVTSELDVRSDRVANCTHKGQEGAFELRTVH
jgi:hypothetical protein